MKFFCILFYSILISSTFARISLSEDTTSPVLIANLHDGNDNIPYYRFQSFLKRTKRQAFTTPSSDHFINTSVSNNRLGTGDEILHNQALIHWSGNNSNVIFILTRRKDSGGGEVKHSFLWRSTDYGKNYVDETHKFGAQPLLKGYFTCPNNKRKLIFMGAHKNHSNQSRVWVTTDEGDTYTVYNLSFVVDKILFHPSKEDWMLGYDNKNKDLFSSTDLGKTWTHLHHDVTPDRYYWFKKNVDRGQGSEKIVHLEYTDFTAFDRPFYYVKSCYIPKCTSSLFQSKCHQLGPVEGNSLLVQDSYVFVQKPGAMEKLYVSYNREEFVKARFHRSGDQTDIHVISSDSNTVVVGVNHDDGITHLYFSDERGRDFSLALDNVLYFNKKVGSTDVFTVDIHEVKSVKGVYIANKRFSFYNRTVITWDNGRSWQPLKVPPSAKKPYCDKTCTLNLHCARANTKSGYYMPVMLSKESAPGVIVAHGSVGKTLVDAPPLATLFVSNDTGLTWRDTLKARNLFMMGDQGSIIIAVSMFFVKPIQVLSLSTDHGVTWKDYKFSEKRISVDGVLTEPGEGSYVFTLFGHESQQGPWMVFTIDMSRVIGRNCSYPDDFANITMPFNSSSCQLGMRRHVEVLRNSGCLVGRNFSRKISTHPCNCSREDYECDFDYVSFHNGQCVKRYPQIDWIDDFIDYDDIFGFPQVSPCVNGKRNVTNGYRKIPGDVCVNELVDLLPNHTVCTTTTSPTTTFTTTTTTITTTTIAGGFYLRLLNYSTKALVDHVLVVKAEGCEGEVKWDVKFLNNTNFFPVFQLTATTLSLRGHVPGTYRVSAACMTKYHERDHVLLSFFYPIDSLLVLHPPVVMRYDAFKAFAFVSGPGELPGIPELVGPVSYSWNYAHYKVANYSSVVTIDTSRFDYPHLLGNTAIPIKISVTATNGVSKKSKSVTLYVKAKVISRTIPLFPVPLLDSSYRSGSWYQELRLVLSQDLLKVKAVTDLLSSKNLHNHHLHVYIKPELPLQAVLYFSTWFPVQGSLTDAQLTKIASQLEDIIMRENIVMHLPHNQKIYVGNRLSSGGLSTVAIVVIVVLSLALVVVIIWFARKYGRLRRWKSYFTMRGTRPNLRLSHIVRPRDHDLERIVNEDSDQDEFFDDVQGPDHLPPDGTLQFKKLEGE